MAFINPMPADYYLKSNTCRGWHIFKKRGEAGQYLKVDGRIRLFLDRDKAIEYAQIHASMQLEAHEEVPNWKA